MKKKRAEKIHFNKRCLERLGTMFDQGHLLNLLKSKQLKFLKRTSNTRTVWKLDNAVFVYDKSRHTFVTAMTYDMWKTTKE